MKNLREKTMDSEIQYIVDQIVSKYKPLKIILFGSAVRNDVEQVNDLDFLIIKEEFLVLLMVLVKILEQ